MIVDGDAMCRRKKMVKREACGVELATPRRRR